MDFSTATQCHTTLHPCHIPVYPYDLADLRRVLRLK
jgi:hypothetical protein